MSFANSRRKSTKVSGKTLASRATGQGDGQGFQFPVAMLIGHLAAAGLHEKEKCGRLSPPIAAMSAPTITR